MALFAYVTGLFIAALLLVSGSQKVRSGGIVQAAANYELLPLGLVRPLAPTLPWLEVVIGACLLIGVFPAAFLLAAAALLLLFSLGILINLLRGRSIDCGCRSQSQPISWVLFGQDLVVASAAFVAAFQNPSGVGLTIFGRGSLTAAEGVALVFALSDAWLIFRLTSTAVAARRALVTITAA